MPPAPVDVADLVKQCLDVITPVATAKNLAVGANIASAMPAHIEADATRLRQVLLNLLGNAVKYTQKGSVQLRIRPAEGTPRFEIVDTGPGIEPGQVDKLFKEFGRLDVDSNGSIEGTGLGLSISARLVLLMGDA